MPCQAELTAQLNATGIPIRDTHDPWLTVSSPYSIIFYTIDEEIDRLMQAIEQVRASQ